MEQTLRTAAPVPEKETAGMFSPQGMALKAPGGSSYVAGPLIKKWGAKADSAKEQLSPGSDPPAPAC